MKSIEDLIDRVAELTLAGKLKWVVAPFSSRAFETELPAGRKLRVNFWLDDSSETSNVSLSLLNGIGSDVLDAIEADNFSIKYQRLSDLYDLARRSAKDVDKVVDDILSGLERLEGEGA